MRAAAAPLTDARAVQSDAGNAAQDIVQAVYRIDPLTDDRWDALVEHHADSSAFHSRGWLRALAQTYGFIPFALTSTPPGRPLDDGLVLCEVDSPLTGKRCVSLPFTDHCQPLLSDDAGSQAFCDCIQEQSTQQGWRYVELRPLRALVQKTSENWKNEHSYRFHRLDLSPSLDEIYARLHSGSMQRRIQRAAKEQLTCEIGRDKKLIYEFFTLMCRTRRRHHVFPQPVAWFENLVECMGDSLRIRLARKNGVAIAGMLTLHHHAQVIYKYGCSDERMHHLCGVPFLFWQLIEESKAASVTEIDLGRSDLDQPGLIMFKDRLGAAKSTITYSRYVPAAAGRGVPVRPGSAADAMKRLVPILPEPMFRAVGRIFYRHMA